MRAGCTRRVQTRSGEGLAVTPRREELADYGRACPAPSLPTTEVCPVQRSSRSFHRVAQTSVARKFRRCAHVASPALYLHPAMAAARSRPDRRGSSHSAAEANTPVREARHHPPVRSAALQPCATERNVGADLFGGERLQPIAAPNASRSGCTKYSLAGCTLRSRQHPLQQQSD